MNITHCKVILCTLFSFLPLVPARILTVTQIVKVAVNTDVGLPCVAVGHPKPTISWYFKRIRIIKRRRRSVPYNNEGKLILSNVRLNDAGAYNCSAVNQYGSDWNLVTLVVQGMLHRVCLQYTTLLYLGTFDVSIRLTNIERPNNIRCILIPFFLLPSTYYVYCRWKVS